MHDIILVKKKPPPKRTSSHSILKCSCLKPKTFHGIPLIKFVSSIPLILALFIPRWNFPREKLLYQYSTMKKQNSKEDEAKFLGIKWISEFVSETRKQGMELMTSHSELVTETSLILKTTAYFFGLLLRTSCRSHNKWIKTEMFNLRGYNAILIHNEAKRV